MTAPHIGNTGVNDEDPESHRIWVSGYVVREPSRLASSWRARRSLDDELKAHGIPGIAVPGTRALTMRIREQGAMRAAVSTVEDDPRRLLDRVLASPGMTGARNPGQDRDHAAPLHGQPARRHRDQVPGRRRRPRHQGRHPAEHGHARHGGPRAARDGHRRGDPGHRPRRGVLQQRARRPGRGRVRGRRDARGARGRRAGVRHLLRQPDPRPGDRAQHVQAALRAPRSGRRR